MVEQLSGAAVDSLIPALIQCFGVIVLGYFAGRWNILTEAQAQGLNSYVTKFALPAVFFKVMVSIDFSDVHWYFVIAVSLSKLVVFVLAFAFTLLLSRQCELGIAGILSMFASQSNDVALGYPVLYSLYPDLASYVYLFAPAQLVVLNPISYVFLEWHQLNRDQIPRDRVTMDELKEPLLVARPSSRCKRCLQVFWRVVLNPIFFMTVIGVVFNFILHHTIPSFLDGLLKVVADSFTATALFTLGFGMVGKMGRISQREVYILVAILLLKLIVCPFVTRELCVQLMTQSSANESLRYSTFGFLYGAIPTAPPVYLFAAEYQVLPAVIGVGLVLGTFLCAPMMFILARMVTMYMADPSEYDQLLGSTVVDVSWTSIACCIWTAIVLFVSRKAFRVPHRFTMCHLFCVLLSCVGVVAGFFLNQTYGVFYHNAEQHNHVMNSPAKWAHYIQFSVFFIGCTGTRLWTFLIALSMLLQRLRGICYVLRHQCLIMLIGFTLPILVTGALLLASSRQLVKDVDPAFQYGRGQLITSLIVLLTCTLGTLACLICYIRKGFINPSTGSGGAYESLRLATYPTNYSTPVNVISGGGEHSPEPGSLTYVQSQMDANASHISVCQCNGQQDCHRALLRYARLCRGADAVRTAVDEPIWQRVDSQDQRHLIFISTLLLTMFFGICLCVWRLVQEAPSGVYIVLEFIDGTFNFGQGLLLFVVFGLDADLIILPIKRAVSSCLRRLFPIALLTNPIRVSSREALTESHPDVRTFVNFHLAHCERAISEHLTAESLPVATFSSQSLKQWLLASGLSRTEQEATEYFDLLESEQVICPAMTASVPASSQNVRYRFTQSVAQLNLDDESQSVSLHENP